MDLERDARTAYESQGLPFDALAEFGHRYPHDMLPEELLDAHLAWQLVNGNMADYFHVTHHYTLLEIQEAMAHKLTTIYLQEEED